MNKDEILKECFEHIYKGLKFYEWEAWKKGSRQYALVSKAFDLIQINAEQSYVDISGKLLEAERELYLAEREIEKLKQDGEILNWIQQIMTPKESYCEVFFAGLRSGNNDATEFQIESNPERFEVLKAKNIREVILLAMCAEEKKFK